MILLLPLSVLVPYLGVHFFGARPLGRLVEQKLGQSWPTSNDINAILSSRICPFS